MKQIKLFSILLLIGAIAVSCKKEKKEELTPEERIVGGVWSLAKISAKYEGSTEEEVLYDSDCTRKSTLEFASEKGINDRTIFASHWVYYEKDGNECKEIFQEYSTVWIGGDRLSINNISKYFWNDKGVFIAKVEFGFEGVFEIMLLKQEVTPEETRIFKFARTY